MDIQLKKKCICRNQMWDRIYTHRIILVLLTRVKSSANTLEEFGITLEVQKSTHTDGAIPLTGVHPGGENSILVPR